MPLAPLMALATLIQVGVGELQFPVDPITPRAIGLGGAGVASPTDASLNPALLFASPRVALLAYEGFSGYRGMLATGTVSFRGLVAISFEVRHFGWDQLIQDSLGSDVSGLDASQSELTLAGAVHALGPLTVGAGISRLALDNFGVETSGIGFSAGASVAIMKRGVLGVAVRNAGGDATTVGTGNRYPLPTRWRVGAAQGIVLGKQALTAMFDLERGGQPVFTSMHSGVEWSWMDLLRIRGGVETVPDYSTGFQRARAAWSFGVGVVISHIELALASRTGGIPEGLETSVGLSFSPR